MPFPPLFGAVATGAAAGILSSKVEEQIDNVTGQGDHPLLDSCIHEDLHNIVRLLMAMKEEMDAPYDKIMVLQPGTLVTLHSHEKPYMMLFANGGVLVNFYVVGVGTVPITLSAGWNVVNLPDGSQIGLPSNASGNANLLFRASDVMYGNSI